MTGFRLFRRRKSSAPQLFSSKPTERESDDDVKVFTNHGAWAIPLGIVVSGIGAGLMGWGIPTLEEEQVKTRECNANRGFLCGLGELTVVSSR